MATLQIRKETSKVWRHIPSDELPYIVSKLYIKSEGDNIRVVELGGSQRGIYNFANVTVYDIGGVAETFTSASELMQRLEALGYIGFFYEGEVSPSTLISADLGNIIELGSDGKLYAIGGSQDLQSVTDLGNYTTNDIKIDYGNGSALLFVDGENNILQKIYGNGNIFGISDIQNGKTLSIEFNDDSDLEALGNGTIATREWADENKVDKVTTAGVERVYTINADGSQGTKATSLLGSDILIASANNILNDNTSSGNVARYTFLVPAGTIKKGARLDFWARITKVNNVAVADNFRIYHTNDFSVLTQTVVATLSINANLYSPFQRAITFDETTGNMFVFGPSTSQNSDIAASTTAISEFTFDTEVDNWFSVFMQVNTSNVMNMRDFKVKLTNPL